MSIRRIAAETLLSVIEDGAYANLALKTASGRVLQKDVAFLYALVYTALDHRSFVEYTLAHYCKRQKRVIRTILLLGCTELLFLHTPSHAAIDEAVRLTKEMGKAQNAGLVNAVLHRINRERNALPPLPADPMERLIVQYGYPAWIVSDWVSTYGYAHTEQLMQSAPSDLMVRAQYPFTTKELQQALEPPTHIGMLDPNCLYVAKGFHPEHSDLFREGKMTVQNEGAMLICRALGDVRGKRILDACAAPGGKTAYLASLCENDVTLTAWELHPHRKALMDAAFLRLHVKAKTEVRDATVLYSDAVEGFDAVLLDVPCTGLGLLGDKPDVRYAKTEDGATAIAKTQRKILSVCSQYVKPGGTLVYATCTISRRENEDQIAGFLAQNPSFTLQDQKQYLPFADGIDGFYHATMKRG